jgi:hypothetical protein
MTGFWVVSLRCGRSTPRLALLACLDALLEASLRRHGVSAPRLVTAATRSNGAPLDDPGGNLHDPDMHPTGGNLCDEDLMHVVAHPELFHLREHVWYALNPTAEMLTAHPDHALPARLGTEVEPFLLLLTAAFGSALQAKATEKVLGRVREEAGTSGNLLVANTRTHHGRDKVRAACHNSLYLL